MPATSFSFAPGARRLFCASILAGAVLCAAPAARAAAAPSQSEIPGGLTLQAVISETGSWESNPLLLVQGAKPLYGSVTAPELLVTDKTPTEQLTIDTLLDENVFNQSNFNSTDVHSKAGYSEQTQRWGLGINEQTDYDTTRTSELTNYGLNGAVIGKSIQHLGFSLTPDLSYSPTSVDKVLVQGSYAQSTYENNLLTDYEVFTASPSYSHDFDPLNTGTFGFQAQRYQTTTGPQATVDTIGPSIGWDTTFTPRFAGKVTAGVQEARQFGAGTTQEPWTLQYDYSADLIFQGEQDRVDFTAARNDFPFANGTEALLTAFALTETHQLNENVALQAGGSYEQAAYQSSLNGALHSLLGGSGGFIYHATDRLDIDTTYQYRRETLTGGAGHADDHVITFGLVYRPKAWTL